ARLGKYFDSIPVPEVQDLEDLDTAIELYHHTVGAGQYDTAFHLYEFRLGNPLYHHFGVYQTCIELLSTLFPNGEDHPPRLKSINDQIKVLRFLSTAYGSFGQFQQAVSLIEQAFILNKKQDEKSAFFTYDLAANLFRLGNMREAYQN